MLVGEGRGPVGEGREGSGAVPRALFARGPACVPPNLLRAGLRTGLTLGFSSDMVARRRWRQAQREPVALERASHALCPAALPPQLSRGRALSLNPGAPVGRAESRGRARARGARPLRRGCALASRDTGRLRMRHGAGQAPGRAQRPGDARLKDLGPETPDVGARLRGHAGSRDALGALVLGQEPEERFGPTGSHFTIHVWGLFLYTCCIWGREGEESQARQANPYRWSGRPVRRHGLWTTHSWNRSLAFNLNVTGGLTSGKGIL